MKDRLVTRDYCLILAANFLLYFTFLPNRNIPYGKCRCGNYPLVLYRSLTLYPSILRLPVRYIGTKTSLSDSLLCFHLDICRIYAGGSIDIIRPVENSTRAGIRYGNSSRKYDCNRHYPILTTRRSSRILWTDE